MHRVGEDLGSGGRDVVPGVGAHHGDVAFLEKGEQLRQRSGRAGDVGVDGTASLPLTELTGAQQQYVALADLESALPFGFLDIRHADAVPARYEIDTAHARRIHQHAARDDPFVCDGYVALGGALAHLHRRRRAAVVQVTVPHEVGVAVDVRDGVAVEDQSEEVHGHLPARAVTRPIRLPGADHEVDGWARDVRRRLVEHEWGGATDGQAVLDQRKGAFGQLGRQIVERPEFVVVSPASPVGERVDPSK